MWIILISAILITGWEQNCKWNKSSAHSCSQLPLYLTIQTTKSYSTSINICRPCTWEFQIPKKLVGALLWEEAINWTQKLHRHHFLPLCWELCQRNQVPFSQCLFFAPDSHIWFSKMCPLSIPIPSLFSSIHFFLWNVFRRLFPTILSQVSPKSHLPHSEQDLFLRKPLVGNFFAQLQTKTSPIPQSFLASQSLLHGLGQPHMIVNRVLSP